MGRSVWPRRFIPGWTETVAALRAEGAEVTAVCWRCSARTLVDLAGVETAMGPLFSFWNRSPPCRVPGCDGRVWFSAQRPNAGTWQTNMKEAAPDAVEPFHARWRAQRRG